MTKRGIVGEMTRVILRNFSSCFALLSGANFRNIGGIDGEGGLKF